MCLVNTLKLFLCNSWITTLAFLIYIEYYWFIVIPPRTSSSWLIINISCFMKYAVGFFVRDWYDIQNNRYLEKKPTKCGSIIFEFDIWLKISNVTLSASTIVCIFQMLHSQVQNSTLFLETASDTQSYIFRSFLPLLIKPNCIFLKAKLYIICFSTILRRIYFCIIWFKISDNFDIADT